MQGLGFRALRLGTRVYLTSRFPNPTPETQHPSMGKFVSEDSASLGPACWAWALRSKGAPYIPLTYATQIKDPYFNFRTLFKEVGDHVEGPYNYP